jgi:hypothetical protein
MQRLNLLSSVFTLSLLMLFSCTKESDGIVSESNGVNQITDMSGLDVSKEGIESLFSTLEKDLNFELKATLVDVKLVSNPNIKGLTKGIYNENTIMIEMIANTGELLRIYSTPSLENENEVYSFSELDGEMSSVMKYNYIINEYGNTNVYCELLPDENGKGWGSCMQGFFSDPFIGTTTQVLGVAGGLGCVPCAGAAGFFTGVAALGCLAAI